MSEHALNRNTLATGLIVVTCYLAVLAVLLYPVAGIIGELG